MLVVPLAEAEVNPPGEIEIEVAPLVAQLRVLLAPELTLVGLAVNEVMEGAEPFPGPDEVVPAQADRPKLATARSASLARRGAIAR
jgi:hypothetical protein